MGVPQVRHTCQIHLHNVTKIRTQRPTDSLSTSLDKCFYRIVRFRHCDIHTQRAVNETIKRDIETRTTGWRQCIKCPQLQVSFRKRAQISRALLREPVYIQIWHPVHRCHPVLTCNRTSSDQHVQGAARSRNRDLYEKTPVKVKTTIKRGQLALYLTDSLL